MSIALYGGSFDPPHLGHLAVVQTALKCLDIERLIVVPAFVNPFKAGTHAPATLRFKWLKAIFSKEEKVTVSDFEILKNRAVASIETVQHFQKEFETIYFIIGADNLVSLKKWHQYQKLNSLVTWVVATRDHIVLDKTYIKLDVNYPISSSTLREDTQEKHLPQTVAKEIKKYYEEHHARSY